VSITNKILICSAFVDNFQGECEAQPYFPPSFDPVIFNYAQYVELRPVFFQADTHNLTTDGNSMANPISWTGAYCFENNQPSLFDSLVSRPYILGPDTTIATPLGIPTYHPTDQIPHMDGLIHQASPGVQMSTYEQALSDLQKEKESGEKLKHELHELQRALQLRNVTQHEAEVQRQRAYQDANKDVHVALQQEHQQLQRDFKSLQREHQKVLDDFGKLQKRHKADEDALEKLQTAHQKLLRDPQAQRQQSDRHLKG
jgi:hypothetical protein